MRKIEDFIVYIFVRYELLKAQFQSYLLGLGKKKNKKEEDEWYL